MLVGGFEIFPVRKSRSKHKNGRFGCVEICDEAVDGLEFEAGVNEDVVFAGSFTSFGPIFERASDGGADGDHAMAGGFGILDGFKGVGGDVEPFGMHMMFFDVVAADGKECAKADVKSEVFDLDAFGLEFLDELFGHVEAGGGSGGGAEFFSPDGLITLDIGLVGVAMKVGRKGNIAVIGNNFGKFAIGGDGSSAVAEDLFDSDNVVCLGAVRDVFDGKFVASMEFTAIHDVVDIAVMFFEYDEFARAAIGKFSEDA